jgi:hypothetical protein
VKAVRRASAVLNDIAADRDQTLPQLRQMLAPPRIALENGGFLAGEAPGYADYVLFATFHDRSRISVTQAVDEVKFRMRSNGDDTCGASGSPDRPHRKAD